MPESNPMKFFVSYSRSVQDKVRQIIETLRGAGEEVWWDQDLRAGQDWWGTILDNIEQCQVCLFIVSEKSVQSPYCMDELRYALARNRLVLPYVIEGLPSYPLPPEIMQGRIQYEPYSGTPDHLIERIRLTCKGIEWAQYKDRYSMRPPEPNTGSQNLVDRLEKAIALANEGLFEAAVTGFNNVAHNDYASYGDFCHQWIDKINRYKEIASLAQHDSMKKLALPKWDAFLRQSAGDGLFDPLGVAVILGTTGAAGRWNPPPHGCAARVCRAGSCAGFTSSSRPPTLRRSCCTRPALSVYSTSTCTAVIASGASLRTDTMSCPCAPAPQARDT
ncbi:toll/interleukin-1 receptor domain-containing protein [bacterium]|nr:toll/interleukin-1 receptor domain-containing protein [bacterium]